MTTTNDLKKGVRIEMDGDPFVIIDVARQTPSARGAGTLVKVKMRNIRTKQQINKSFKAGERVKDPDFEIRPCQYLYDDGGSNYFFMDTESFEQFELSREAIETELGFIRPEDEVRALFFDGACLGIEVPNTVTLLITQCDPGVRGDTVNNVTKPALLETGLEIQVPLFVEEGIKVVVDTRDCRYIKRA
jgi:elongation factor P